MASSLLSRIITLIILAAIGLLVVDVNKHGSFKASQTGRFLKDSGALHYGEIAWSHFRVYSQQGYSWCQKNVPVYVTKTREITAPYLRSALDLLSTIAQQLWANVKLLYGYFLEKKPIVEQWINQYAPGLVEMVGSWLRQAWTVINEFTMLLVKLLLKYLTVAWQWLMENVFVGSLSPENLQRYTMEALNTTQVLASQTYSWLSNKLVTVTSTS